MFNVSWSESSLSPSAPISIGNASTSIQLLPTHHANCNYFLQLQCQLILYTKHFTSSFSRCLTHPHVDYSVWVHLFNSIQFDLIDFWICMLYIVVTNFFLEAMQSVDNANPYLYASTLSEMIAFNYFILSENELEKVNFGLVFFCCWLFPTSGQGIFCSFRFGWNLNHFIPVRAQAYRIREGILYMCSLDIWTKLF